MHAHGYIQYIKACVSVCLCACYLLAQGHATAQSAGEADDFGHERFESEVFLEHNSSQDGLHLWNP